MKDLRIMSYNIKGHAARSRQKHVEQLAETILALKPDVIGLQEVHRRTLRSGGVDQLEELQKLTGLEAVFGRSLNRDDGGEYGNAILARGDVLESQAHSLPGTGEPRSMLASELEIAGRRLMFYVTHFSAWGRFGRRNRMQQAEAATGIIRNSSLPFILTGDFNTGPSAEELRVFHHGDLVVSCFAKPSITHRSTRSCLDYIFVDPGWEITHSEVVRTGPSDHWPLVAELRRKWQESLEVDSTQ